MIQKVYLEEMEGFMIERVTRDEEYSMQYRHFHDGYELYFLMEGERYYFIDKETYRVEKGMVVLVKRNQIHKTSMAQKSYHDRILVHLREEIFDPFLKANGLFTLEELFETNYGVLGIRPEDWEQTGQLLMQIHRELKRKMGNYQMMVKMKMAEILLLLYRNRKTAKFVQESQKVLTVKHQKVHEIADYLLNHCETNENLEELAARFYISKSYISRIFKEVTGFTINEYQNVSRVQQAKHLLLHSEYSVTEISERLGFESITYFERVFKKYVDTTPLKYRKKGTF
ncbi:MAG: helix-turn-helix transcriptional regulator [Clostridiaceae bacterium]|nr:helix-turn-helix transcriptional regulator [Clostridiaceae bacterium]